MWLLLLLAALLGPELVPPATSVRTLISRERALPVQPSPLAQLAPALSLLVTVAVQLD